MNDLANPPRPRAPAMRVADHLPAGGEDPALASVSYGRGAGAAPAGGGTLLARGAFGPVPLEVLEGPALLHAIWSAHGPVHTSRSGRVAMRHDHDLIFGYLEVQEEGPGLLREASFEAYSEVFDALEVSGHAHLVRCWNYVPRINAAEDGLERYRQFNIGRQDAFLLHDRAPGAGAPAACALGSPDGPLIVFFIASRTAPRSIENPRQVSAYHYPSQYGPRSPTFSRAALLPLEGADALFISGTASIVGHESLHLGDVAEQAREALRNVDAVLEEAARQARHGRFTPQELCWKAYLRNPGDLAVVQQAFGELHGDSLDIAWLRADVCRSELLVEFEAMGVRAEPAG